MDITNAESERLNFEQALSHARSIFPNNTRAQDLLARSITGSLKSEEQEELNKLFARKKQEKGLVLM